MADNQIFELTSDLGPDLIFNRMRGEEQISHLFAYELDLLSAKAEIDPDDVLGKPMVLKVGLSDGSTRCFTGYVTNFTEGATEGNNYLYYATLRPWLWFLTRNADCRIFQEMKVPDILDVIFGKYPNIKKESRLTANYRTWDYCVQYRETDFNFVSRLMEHEGIYYHFEHAEDGHTLVLSDTTDTHVEIPGFDTLFYVPPSEKARSGTDAIRDWRLTKGIKTAQYETRDYNFTTPNAPLTVHKTGLATQAVTDSEFFDYPGGYAQVSDGENYVGIRIEELQASYDRSRGSGNVRALATGYQFTLAGYPRDALNAKYLVTRAKYTMQNAGYGAGHVQSADYQVEFTVIPSTVHFRPKRATRKPFVQGPQTAVVVGPAGSEIYTDKYGRVKVQFFWDRLGTEDENSSCWIRVSHPWAGKGFGMVAIPRIHQEVIVDFLEGDPDQPIITGRLYNADQTTPYDLPANMTQSGIKSRSSPGGNTKTFNEIRLEDKFGAEQLVISAQKDMITSVKNNATRTVTVNDTQTVHGDSSLSIVGKQTITITGTMGETITGKVTTTYNGGKFETVNSGLTEVVTGGKKVDITGDRHEEIKGTASTHSTGPTNVGSDGKMTVVSGGDDLWTTSASDTKIIAGGKMVMSAGGDFKALAPNFKFATAGDMNFSATNFNRVIMQGNDTILGPNSNAYMGNASDTKIGMARSTFLGLKQDTSVSAGIYIDVALKMGTAVGVELKLNAAASIETKVACIQQASMDLELKGLKVISGGGGGGGGGAGAGAAAGAVEGGAVAGGSIMAGAAAASGLVAAILGISDAAGAVDSYNKADKEMGLTRTGFSGWGALAGGLLMGPAGVVVGGLIGAPIQASQDNAKASMPVPADPDIPAPPPNPNAANPPAAGGGAPASGTGASPSPSAGPAPSASPAAGSGPAPGASPGATPSPSPGPSPTPKN